MPAGATSAYSIRAFILFLRAVPSNPGRTDSAFMLLLVLVHGGERYRRMGVSTSRSHLGGDPDRLHDFLRACAVFHRCFGVTPDAIRELRDVSGRDSNKLFYFNRQRALGKHTLTERIERGLDSGCQLTTLASEILG